MRKAFEPQMEIGETGIQKFGDPVQHLSGLGAHEGGGPDHGSGYRAGRKARSSL